MGVDTRAAESMIRRTFLQALAFAALTLSASSCAFLTNENPASLRDQVTNAMATVQFDYRFIDSLSSPEYAVFRVDVPQSNDSIDIAWGGKGVPADCPKGPKLPHSVEREGVPFSEVVAELTICLKHNGFRPNSTRAAGVARARTLNSVALALCEETYGPYECMD